jgi:hypothetical protein
MSKRKNTLNDLEEFLKLQASTLVPPQPVESSRPLEVPKEESRIAQPLEQPTIASPAHSAKPMDLLEEMKKLAIQNKSNFYDHIIKAAEAMPDGANDVLLINTALYLKHGDNWKGGIEEYWRKRKSQLAV